MRGFKEINRVKETKTQMVKKQNEYEAVINIYEHDSKITSDAKRRFKEPPYFIRKGNNGR